MQHTNWLLPKLWWHIPQTFNQVYRNGIVPFQQFCAHDPHDPVSIRRTFIFAVCGSFIALITLPFLNRNQINERRSLSRLLAFVEQKTKYLHTVCYYLRGDSAGDENMFVCLFVCGNGQQMWTVFAIWTSPNQTESTIWNLINDFKTTIFIFACAQISNLHRCQPGSQPARDQEAEKKSNTSDLIL